MKLYEDGRAPNPRRVRIFLAEKGIDIPRVQVDIMNREQYSDEMLSLNPMARLPFLVLDDGTVIAETIAICRYFEAVQPDPPLFGHDPLSIAVIEMWQRRVELNLLMAIASAFRHLHPRMAHLEVPQVKEWGEANRPKAEAMLDMLEKVLADRSFVAGERFSVADITLLCALDFMKVARLELKDEHAALKRWHAEVSARPSAVV